MTAQAVSTISTRQAPPLAMPLGDPFGLDRETKRSGLLAALNGLSQWHAQSCTPYSQAVERVFDEVCPDALERVPFLPVSMFKTHELLSIGKEDIFKTLNSSGTTGQAVSRIVLDRETAGRQTRALSSIVGTFLGQQRWPMVIVDSAELLKDRTRFNARAAGILGYSTFGRSHHYCLNEQLQLQPQALHDWLEQHQGVPVLAFGFTAVVWQGLVEGARRSGLKLNFGPGSTLIHGGGWKRLADRRIDNDTFKRVLREELGFERILNYYGMVEQVGSIFMECEHGHLHAPAFADVIVRDPVSLRVQPIGKPGVIQVLSALPVSYPGHSLLTEDVGMIYGEDDCPCGRLGKHFTVSGRLPAAELRGCSDTRSIP